jgi:two-component system, OmpR family, response regulator
MAASRIVVIEHDEWLMRLLLEGLRDAGFVVTTATSVADGLAKVRELLPDCVLCEVTVPGSGYELPRQLRKEPPPISLTPVAMLAPDDDVNARTTTFEAGADALITRPFRLDEVAGQLNALVELARRMRARRNSLIDSLSGAPPSSADAASFHGDLEHMPVASLLTLLELERKTGSVSVKSGKRRAKLELADGHVASGAIDGITIDPVSVLRDALDWQDGTITFRARAAEPRPANARSIRIILAEARPGTAPVLASSTRQSSARLQAIPPPPGKRIQAADSPIKPALVEVPTRRVDVPEKPRSAGDGPKSDPPSTKRNP